MNGTPGQLVQLQYNDCTEEWLCRGPQDWTAESVDAIFRSEFVDLTKHSARAVPLRYAMLNCAVEIEMHSCRFSYAVVGEQRQRVLQSPNSWAILQTRGPRADGVLTLCAHDADAPMSTPQVAPVVNSLSVYSLPFPRPRCIADLLARVPPPPPVRLADYPK